MRRYGHITWKIKQQRQPVKLEAVKSTVCDFNTESFKSNSGGTLCLLPGLPHIHTG